MKTEAKKRSAMLMWVAVLALACVALLALAGCSGASGGSGNGNGNGNGNSSSESAQTRMFVDSLGREVEVPVNIERIATTSNTGQQVLLTMAPEKMVGLAQKLSEGEAKYLGEELNELPVLGSLYNAKGDLNKEALAAANPQVIIDTGERKAGIEEDLQTLQDQLGIPVIFIETKLDGYGDAYRMLGDLLGMQERGEEMGAYCDAAYAQVNGVMEGIAQEDRVRFAYLLGDAGLSAIAQGSYQGQVVDMITNNVVVVENASTKGSGNEISLEQIAVWNPDMIVFGVNSIYDTVGDEPAWKGISAVDAGNYYEVPAEPFIWLNNPPTVNQILGMQWLARLCYPSQFNDDMQQMVTEYYQMFYGYDLTDAEYAELMANAA